MSAVPLAGVKTQKVSMASSVSHGPSRERLGALEKIEGNIASAIQSAGISS